jgi:hypothetical protein
MPRRNTSDQQQPGDEANVERLLSELRIRYDDLEALVAVSDAAEAFIATTSVFRQPKSSRPEFEALVWAVWAMRR